MITNAHEILGGMSIEVTVGEFHKIHDIARKAENQVNRNELEKLPTQELLDILSKLEAGERLTTAETGPDSVYAHSYFDSMSKVKKVINRRK
jgi:hypothetical protein